jgi:hypothetical protein
MRPDTGIVLYSKLFHISCISITRNVGQDGGHDKKLRNKMASDNARISIVCFHANRCDVTRI